MKRVMGLFAAALLTIGLVAACGRSQSTVLIPPESDEQPAGGGGSGPAAPPDLDALGIGQSAEAEQVLALINNQRAQNGCPPLTQNSVLTIVAYGHSEDMGLRDYFAHDSPDGAKFSDRILGAGYQFSMAAENVAAGTNDLEQLVQLWMDSPGHRANIVNCELKETGVGYFFLENDTGNTNYFHYWTQVFASP